MKRDEKYEIERLREQLNQVTAERNRLLADNLRLARQLGQKEKASGKSTTGTDVNAVTLPHGISRESQALQKIQMFRSLLRGREDVFPRLWQNRRTLKTGYSPVCKREWDTVYCRKPRIKCGDCPNRDFAPITDDVIRKHLQGDHTIGLYPLLPEETCYLLAIDFDKRSWMDDADAYLETCCRMGVPAAIERSRSGNGAHIWIFFADAVSASAARKLGCYLLTETMSRRHQLGMDSYDRLFPNQDTLPKGGFGNLIALPFQKEAVRKGNTVFLDENFRPYEDQWAFLSSVPRMESASLDQVIQEAARNGQVIGVGYSSPDSEDQPWSMPPSRRLPEFPPDGPIPEKTNVAIGNLVYVEKNGLSSSVLNRIKRLAAFQNPEFYKKQGMRLSTAKTPRVITCAEEFPKHAGLPRGCLDELLLLLEGIGIRPVIVDKRIQGTKIDVVFHGELNPAQQEAASNLIRHDNGVLVAPSGSGKTVFAIHMIAARQTNTLVLVHRRPLLEQWQAQIATFLNIDPKTVGQIGGSKRRPSGVVDVAMLQSLIKKGEVDDLVGEYGQVIVDECHHLPAVTFEQVLKQIKARYVLGLTATPYRRDGHHPIILMQCGPVRHMIGQRDQGVQRILRHRLVCRNTDFVLPLHEDDWSIQEIYSMLATDEIRNWLIISDVVEVLGEGRCPIVLTERRDHLELLAGELARLVRHVIVLRGGMGVRQRRAIAQQMASIPKEEGRVLVATGRYIGEGFDDIHLDTLFLAMPVSWKGTLVQYAGRLHRLHPEKTEVRVYDYIDKNVPVLARMFRKRLRGYAAMGYEVEEAKLIAEQANG